MAVGDCYKLVITMTQLGSYYQNTLAFRMVAAPDPTLSQVTTLANDYKETWRALQHQSLIYRDYKMFKVFGSGVVYDQTQCKREGGLVFQQNYTGTVAGGQATPALPPQCALVTTLYSNQIGRRRRGRLYIPAWTEAQQTDGSWDAAHLTALTTPVTTFLNKYAGPGTDPTFAWGIWSERLAFGCVQREMPPFDHYHADPPHPELAFVDINRFVLRSLVYTQRRRVIGVGR